MVIGFVPVSNAMPTALVSVEAMLTSPSLANPAETPSRVSVTTPLLSGVVEEETELMAVPFRDNPVKSPAASEDGSIGWDRTILTAVGLTSVALTTYGASHAVLCSSGTICPRMFPLERWTCRYSPSLQRASYWVASGLESPGSMPTGSEGSHTPEMVVVPLLIFRLLASPNGDIMLNACAPVDEAFPMCTWIFVRSSSAVSRVCSVVVSMPSRSIT